MKNLQDKQKDWDEIEKMREPLEIELKFPEKYSRFQNLCDQYETNYGSPFNPNEFKAERLRHER